MQLCSKKGVIPTSTSYYLNNKSMVNNVSVLLLSILFVYMFFFSVLNPQNILMIHCSSSYFKHKPMLLFNLSAMYGPRQRNRCKCHLLQSYLQIIWMTLPEPTKFLSIFKHCGCKGGCKGRCLCRKIELRCSELCQCLVP